VSAAESPHVIVPRSRRYSRIDLTCWARVFRWTEKKAQAVTLFVRSGRVIDQVSPKRASQEARKQGRAASRVSLLNRRLSDQPASLDTITRLRCSVLFLPLETVPPSRSTAVPLRLPPCSQSRPAALSLWQRRAIVLYFCRWGKWGLGDFPNAPDTRATHARGRESGTIARR